MRYLILRPLLLVGLVLILVFVAATRALPAGPRRAMVASRPFLMGRPAFGPQLNLKAIAAHRAMLLRGSLFHPSRFLAGSGLRLATVGPRNGFVFGAAFTGALPGFSGGPINMMGYGGGGGMGYPPAAGMAPALPPAEAEPEQPVPEQPKPDPFAFLGLPSVDGQLNWPLGLRILAPTLQTTPLRQQIEAELQMIATQAMAGSVDGQLVKRTKEHAQELRRYLTANEVKLTPYAAREAREFLDALDKALAAR
jgi:hypothetical protein